MIIEHLIYSGLELSPLYGCLFILFGLFHVIIKRILRARYYYLYFADVETEALKIKSFIYSPQVVGQGANSQAKAM